MAGLIKSLNITDAILSGFTVAREAKKQELAIHKIYLTHLWRQGAACHVSRGCGRP